MAQIDLDPYELALYSNYKQTASDNPNGGAWKSNETLAKECSMSPRKVTQVRQALVTKGYIHVQYETSENGKEYSAAIVTIVDVWQQNHERFSKNTIAQGANPPSHDMLSPIAQGANKEESLKKKKENKDNPIFDWVSVNCFNLDRHNDNDKPELKRNAGRIGKIVSYLAEKETSVMLLNGFREWYKNQFPTLDLPRDDAKFSNHYKNYLDSQSAKSSLEIISTQIFSENNLATDGVIQFPKRTK